MSFVIAAVAVGAAAGIAKVGIGISQRNKAKKAADDARVQMDADKEKYMNMPIENPYKNMENTMEDLTVETQAADFAAEKSAQARANIMDEMKGAAGGSGIAALAQTLANQAQMESQQASASIASQEKANQDAERAEAGNIQDLERQGEIQKQNLERDRLATALGMSQAELTAEQQNIADSEAMIMSGVSDIGSAASSAAAAKSGKDKE